MNQSSESDQQANEQDFAPVSEEAERHWQDWKAFSLVAYASFQDTIERIRKRHPGLTSYDAVERIDATKGTFAWSWGAAGEMREAVNSINAWGVRLHEWSAWNDVVAGYENREDQWDVLNHFLEPVAFYCMLQPSSFVDRLALTAETLLHQANRRIFPDEADRLIHDDRPGKPPRRSDRRKQLCKSGSRWANFGAFQQALHALDGDEYRRLTHNFRDLASHSFSPRLMLGHVPRAIRSIVPWKELVQQSDDSYRRVEHPTKKVVSYAMSSLEPLALDVAHQANLSEYQKARKGIDQLAALVDELCDQMDHAATDAAKAP